MTARTLNDIVTLGAVTGMRSMAGLAALALRREGLLTRVVTVMAGGEMVVDKTSFAGDRVDPLPLAGRACCGALVGGIIAREEQTNVLAAAMIGAATAVAMTELAYRVRKELPVPPLVGGLLEDAIVVALAASYVSRRG